MSFSIGKKAPRTRSYANWIKGIEAKEAPAVAPKVTKPRVRKAAVTTSIDVGMGRLPNGLFYIDEASLGPWTGGTTPV